jgi:AraC-like DNA-binding protein
MRAQVEPGGIAGRIVVRMLDFASDRGRDPGPLCRELGLTRDQLREPGARVPYAVVERLGTGVLALAQDPNLGLHLACDVRDAPTFDAGVLLMMASPTLELALARMEQIQRYWADGTRFALVPTARGVAVRYLVRAALGAYQRHTDECALAEIVLGARRLTARPDLTPLAVRFRHAAPAELEEHRALFGAPLEFDAPCCELELDRTSLALPLPQANEAFRLFFQAQVERALAERPAAAGLVADVRALARATLAGGQCSIETVARALGLSPRTLQRRLQREGTSFAGVLDAERRELAHTFLAQARPLQEIAWLLGYTDASAFHHAFKRWTGMTPERARASQRDPTHS